MSSYKNIISDLEKHCIRFNDDEETIRCTIEGEESYEKFSRKLKEAGISFSVRSSSAKRDGKLMYSNQKLGIDFFGFPFTVLNHRLLECVIGPENPKKVKKNQLEVNEHTPSKNGETRFRRKYSRKIGCTAAMKVSTIKYFPEYSVKQDAPNIHDRKYECMQRLKTDLQKNEGNAAFKTRFYVSMSHPSTHSHPLQTSLMTQQLDDRLKTEIKRLVHDGITDVIFIKTALRSYVARNFSPSIPQQARAFHPSNRTIYNFILKFVKELKDSESDQMSLQNDNDVWQTRSHVITHYRPSDSEAVYESQGTPESHHGDLDPIESFPLSPICISTENVIESANEFVNVLRLIPENADPNLLRFLNNSIMDLKNAAEKLILKSEDILCVV